MIRSFLVYMFLCVYSFGLTMATTSVQTVLGAASTNVHVDAPFARTLVDKAMAQHADIRELGIHAVPPGNTNNVIIACNIRAKSQRP